MAPSNKFLEIKSQYETITYEGFCEQNGLLFNIKKKGGDSFKVGFDIRYY